MPESLSIVAQRAQDACREISVASNSTKNAALEAISVELEANRSIIENSNRIDKSKASAAGTSTALQSRLDIEGSKYSTLLQGLRDVISLPDPVGLLSLHSDLDDGLTLFRVSCPIGVLCVIFESRPEAVIQIASLAIKSANAVILKGGKEAMESNKALVKACRTGLKKAGLSEDVVQLVSSREDIQALLKLDEYIDLVIPRGSNSLVKSVMNSTRIPVLGHSNGICTVYVDSKADIDKAVKIVLDSKTQYVAACNAAETLLLHEKCVETMLPVIGKALGDAGVMMHVEENILPLVPADMAVVVTEEDFRTEYLGLEIAIKVVPSVAEAIKHINTHGSHHTDCIVTEDGAAAEQFLKGISSAGAFHNASTRFADGYRFGFGAEVGVSTNRIHARGPVGLEGLLTYKYRLHGSGQCVAQYGVGKRQYTHKTFKLNTKEPRVPTLDKPSHQNTFGIKQECLIGLGLLGAASVAGMILLRVVGKRD